MNDTKKRTELLTVLCILTFIGSGTSLLANGVLYLMFDQLKELIEQQSVFSFMGSEIDLSFLLDIKSGFFLTQVLIYALSLYGAVQMFQLRKIGFHLYAMAQIALLIIPKIFVPNLPFPFFELMVSAVFVYLYYKNLHLMTK